MRNSQYSVYRVDVRRRGRRAVYQLRLVFFSIENRIPGYNYRLTRLLPCLYINRLDRNNRRLGSACTQSPGAPANFVHRRHPHIILGIVKQGAYFHRRAIPHGRSSVFPIIRFIYVGISAISYLIVLGGGSQGPTDMHHMTHRACSNSNCGGGIRRCGIWHGCSLYRSTPCAPADCPAISRVGASRPYLEFVRGIID